MPGEYICILWGQWGSSLGGERLLEFDFLLFFVFFVSKYVSLPLSTPPFYLQYISYFVV